MWVSWYSTQQHPVLQRVLWPEKLSDEQRIDFSAIEPALEQLAIEEGITFQLTPELTTPLNRLTRPFVDKTLTQPQLQRLTFLITQSLPNDRNQTISQLFEPYLDYQKVKLRMTEAAKPQTPAQALQLHQQLIPIRERILGQNPSRILFSQHDQFTERLLQQQLSRLATDTDNKGKQPDA
jgi:hypothetical protein